MAVANEYTHATKLAKAAASWADCMEQLQDAQEAGETGDDLDGYLDNCQAAHEALRDQWRDLDNYYVGRLAGASEQAGRHFE